jgi:hypothetical protein
MTPRPRRAPLFGSLLLFFALAALAGSAVRPDRALAVKLNEPAPEIADGSGGAMTGWINSAPLTMAGLKGRIVLVEFWTYG